MLSSSAIIQLIGFAGVAALVSSFQFNKRSHILVALLITQILFATHYSLLHAWTGVAMNVIAILRGCVFYFKPKYGWAQWFGWVYMFIALLILATAATWAGYLSLLPLIGMSIETIGLWQNHPKHIRWYMLACRPFWFTYAILIGSYAGMTADILTSISLIIGMVRFDRKKT